MTLFNLGSDFYSKERNEKIDLKAISHILENAKHEEFTKDHVDYFRQKAPKMSNADLLRIQEMFQRVLRRYGEKISENNIQSLFRMNKICESELKRRGAPTSLTKDSFRNPKFDIKKYF
jgi:hypothetical protein